MDELIFRASAWAIGTRTVRLSNGSNELIAKDREEPNQAEKPEESVKQNPSFYPEKHTEPGADEFPFEVENPGWSRVGVVREVDGEEQVFEMHRSGVIWRVIDDASQLDSPKRLPMNRPKKGSIQKKFDYQ